MIHPTGIGDEPGSEPDEVDIDIEPVVGGGEAHDYVERSESPDHD